jgi:hypothetical protein
MSKEKIISKREDFWLWSVSRSLSFKTYDLSKTKRRKIVLVFGGHSLAFSLSSRKQRDDDDESTERNVPVLSLRPSSLLRGEEKGKRSDYIGKIQKCETFARWENHNNKRSSSIQRGRRVSVASLDHYRNDRERCTEDKDVYETHHVQQVHPHGHVSVASVVVKTGAS